MKVAHQGRLALLCAVSVSFLGHVASAVVGVSKEDLAKYDPRPGNTFMCFNGQGEPLGFKAVNDNFCDCEDGSDEPGTGACAGQDVTLFHCNNEHSQARQIYASMVDDGLCDCCDGTDEAGRASRSQEIGQAGTCPNTCVEEGAELAKERAFRHQTLVEGKAKRAEIVAKAIEERQQAQARLEEVRKERPLLEEQLHAAEEVAKKAKEEAEAAANHTDTQTQIDELRGLLAEQAQQIKTLQQEVAELRAAGAPQGHEANPEAVHNKIHLKPKVSEYAKWMDNAEAMAGDIEGGEDIEGAIGDGEAEAGEATADPDLAEAEAAAAAAVPSGVQSATPAVEEKSPEVKELEDKISTAKREERTLRKKISNRPEDRLHYADLDGKCIEKKDAEYTYKACFFDDAKQDHTSLGRWKEWTGPHSALFDRGAMCHGGPERTCHVYFECGTETAVVDITEPSRCAYEMIITHPGACEASEEDVLNGPKVLQPKDEL